MLIHVATIVNHWNGSIFPDCSQNICSPSTVAENDHAHTPHPTVRSSSVPEALSSSTCTVDAGVTGQEFTRQYAKRSINFQRGSSFEENGEWRGDTKSAGLSSGHRDDANSEVVQQHMPVVSKLQTSENRHSLIWYMKYVHKLSYIMQNWSILLPGYYSILALHSTSIMCLSDFLSLWTTYRYTFSFLQLIPTIAQIHMVRILWELHPHSLGKAGEFNELNVTLILVTLFFLRMRLWS